MAIYKRPQKNLHRGFFYLDDETVINSLSAFEAGKVDEVVQKINSNREGGAGGGIESFGLRAEVGRKRSSSLEEELVRVRTRFSVFELWYQSLVTEKAIGRFDGWGPSALNGVEAGQTVELTAQIEAVPLYTLARLFLWFADKAKSQGHIFSQKGEELKQTKDSERTMRMLLGDSNDEKSEQIALLATPLGEPGPLVAMHIKREWSIGAIGSLGGQYTVVGQVDRIIPDGEEFPIVRLTTEAASTPREVEVLKEAVSAFVEPAREFGLELSQNESVIAGPAMWLEPVAIYR